MISENQFQSKQTEPKWKKGAYIYDIMEKQLDPITTIIHGKDVRGEKLCIIFDRVTPQY